MHADGAGDLQRSSTLRHRHVERSSRPIRKCKRNHHRAGHEALMTTRLTLQTSKRAMAIVSLVLVAACGQRDYVELLSDNIRAIDYGGQGQEVVLPDGNTSAIGIVEGKDYST